THLGGTYFENHLVIKYMDIVHIFN
ncbi:hypothetical protein, partial [Plasmodium yoelii yoelii]